VIGLLQYKDRAYINITVPLLYSPPNSDILSHTLL